ncbi:MAG TPA: GNAT family N-acetyltransferase [Smithellaceae bacterium]|nr:GNAT family N-acetyltransferase [Smithellaceae bacterium]HRS89449.1 GNAT family N-acetyltransferase [Smithellaceae bacterium]HRV26398.1 GNAT family N-acetyltransferase [Smithellaceae bacterium]
MEEIKYRRRIKPTDVAAIEEIVRASGFFSTAETEIAVELAQEKLELGSDSSYEFLFAEDAGRVIGYACWGLIPATMGSYDIYWIAIQPQLRGRGIGKKLLTETEKIIFEAGGRQIYVDTSSRQQYEPTRIFYEKCGYHQGALLKDFYAPGDGKIIYVKILK